METKDFKGSPLEMPLSCKSIMEKVEQELREEDEQEEAVKRETSNKDMRK